VDKVALCADHIVRHFGTVAVWHLAPVVQTTDIAIRRMNHYPLDDSTGFARVYLLDIDLSGG